MRKTKEKTKWYFLIAVALFIGAIIGFFATTNLSTLGRADYIIASGTIQDCCAGSNSNGSTYSQGIKDGCCILIQLGYPSNEPITDSCTIEAYNQEGCNTQFKNMVNQLN